MGALIKVGGIVEGGVEFVECTFFGMLVWIAVNSTHHLLYCPWSSSLRVFMLVEEIVDSVRWKCESNLQAFDHHENLDLDAMAL